MQNRRSSGSMNGFQISKSVIICGTSVALEVLGIFTAGSIIRQKIRSFKECIDNVAQEIVSALLLNSMKNYLKSRICIPKRQRLFGICSRRLVAECLVVPTANS
jgi:hypothetical protein